MNKIQITQAVMTPISKLNYKQVIESIKLIKKLIDSRRYKYNLEHLCNRLRNLEENEEFYRNES